MPVFGMKLILNKKNLISVFQKFKIHFLYFLIFPLFIFSLNLVFFARVIVGFEVGVGVGHHPIFNFFIFSFLFFSKMSGF